MHALSFLPAVLSLSHKCLCELRVLISWQLEQHSAVFLAQASAALSQLSHSSLSGVGERKPTPGVGHGSLRTHSSWLLHTENVFIALVTLYPELQAH